jgi:glucoamylase
MVRDAGDAMLRAILRHSDHLELSEQFNGSSGFEWGVRNLTWSTATFMSAVRARS